MQQPTLIDLDPAAKSGTLERVAFDFYETPPDLVREFCRKIDRHLRGKMVLEPCVGDGAIARVLREEFDCRVVTNDLDQGRQADTHIDAGNAALYRYWLPTGIDLVLTNPPFDQAGVIAANAVSHGLLTILLTPLNFREPVEDRAVFLRDHPPQHAHSTQRAKFRKDTAGTAPISTEWLIWTPDQQLLEGVRPLDVVLWKK
jgi:hypothetical protein